MLKQLLADVLNRVLGAYVENFDSEQLTIGIWGGDLKFDNLKFKTTALDDLGLPFKIKYGSLDSLAVKIPWQDIYTQPTVAKVVGLQAIIVPSRGVPFDEESTSSRQNEIKQKQLNRLENNRRKIRKPDEPMVSDTLAERLATQVVKNLQLTIEKIHIRYEDKYTNPEKPFAAGVTLESLQFETTDSDFKRTIQTEAIKLFHKLVSMKSLAIYLNTRAAMISECPEDDRKRALLQSTIATEEKKLDTFSYLFGPISATAKLTLNPKPETSNWRDPKIDVIIEMEKMVMALSSYQYRTFFAFLDALPRFAAGEKFRKYRPDLALHKGHAREWWKFLYESIRGDVVQRRRKNWSWEHIQRHTAMVEKYSKAWITFRTQKHPPEEVLNLIKRSERELDVFNLNIARQQAEMEIDRKKLRRVEDHEVQGWVAWAASYLPFGPQGATVAKGDITTDHIVNEIERAWDSDEKKKLFAAIDYQEHIQAREYPEKYVAHRIVFKLGLAEVVIDSALKLQLQDFVLSCDRTPSISRYDVRISTAVSAITCEAGAKSRRILQESRFTSNGYVTDKEKSFAVASQAMHFKVNSNTIRLINSVLKRFFWDAKEGEISIEQALRGVMSHGEAGKSWSIQELFKTAKPATTASLKPLPTTERIHFSVDFFTISLALDDGASKMPMLLLESNVQVTLENWSKNLTADGGAQLQLSYYNQAKHKWEPIIEQHRYEAEKSWQKWHLALKLRTERMAQGESKGSSPARVHPKRVLTLESNQMMNVTVTRSLIALTDDLVSIYKSISFGDPHAERKEKARVEELECELQVHALSISIVDDKRMIEVANVSIVGPGIRWEVWEKERYRVVTGKMAEELEVNYQAWMKKGMPDEVVTLRNLVQVSFKYWTGKDPRGQMTKIRRSNKNGLWMQYRRSLHQDSLHMRIHTLQMDNQLYASAFRVALTPVPPAKSVGPPEDRKPFVELYVVSNTQLTEVKCLTLEMQEMVAKFDTGFITSMLAMLAPTLGPTMSRKPSSQTSSGAGSVNHPPGIYYRSIKFLPVTVHLSYSRWISGPTDKELHEERESFDVFTTLLQSVGITLTDFQDIQFKMAQFERKSIRYTRPRLLREINTHYRDQFLKQLYVYLLGLGLLGNPYRLAQNFATGIEDVFVQPVKGAAAGPEEFAQGMAYGFKSLFSNIVGGTTGAVARITDTVGRGVAVLTMDDEYQRDRMEKLNKKPSGGLVGGVLKGAGRLGAGLFEGAKGVITKPIQGAKDGGVPGFVVGVGKGVVGAVTRPVSGAVDCVGGTLTAIKTAISGADIQPVRAARDLQDPESGYHYRPFC